MKKKLFLIILISIILLMSFYYFYNKIYNKKINYLENMKIESVFGNNEKIPVKYTADGDDINPPLTISEIPENAKILVLINDDPDAPAGTWVHWIVFNIPVKNNTLEILENSVPENAELGINDFKRLRYGGPAPPSGTHRYFFKIYALDNKLNLKQGATKSEIEKEMQGHILDKTELIGVYNRFLN